MKVHAEVLTSPSSDTPGTTLLIHFDNKRYVFGRFGEGSQRAFMERHVRLNKVGNLFLTGPVQWSSTGGLVGIMLALGDPDGTKTSAVGDSREREKQQVVADPPGIAIHGGENLLYTLSTMRRFVFRTGMSLAVKEIERGAPDFRDENVVVRMLHVLPDDLPARPPDPESKKAFLGKAVNDMFCSSWTMNTMLDDEEGIEPAARNLQLSTLLPPKGKTRAPWPASTIARLPETTPNTEALSYILQLHEQRGKFLPALAKKLGVKPGPEFSKLANGQSVTTAAGKVVNPEDVMEPSREGTGIAICDIPSPAYLANFVAAEKWEDTDTMQRRVGCFFWLVPGTVILDSRFQQFVARFPKSRHILCSSDVCPDRINFKGATKSAVLLNSLDPEFFPDPKLDCAIRQSIDPSLFEIAAPGLQWQIEPKWQLQTETVEPPFNRQAIIDSDSFKALSVVVREYQQSLPSLEQLQTPGSNVEIFTLGTGSSLPSRHRNVSSTLVRIPGTGSMLLDCGEGTLGQLKRLFSHEEGGLDSVLTDIKVLYISHLHADHHLGSTSVLAAKHRLQPEARVFIVAPEIFRAWLKEYAQAEPGMDEVLAHIVFVSNESLQSGAEQPESLLHAFSLTKLETAPAIHCLSSFTVSLTFSLDGGVFKLSYSGDTRPNDAFVDIGMDSTVLIHEATFEDNMVAQARKKKHATIGEALDVARRMRARAVVLTHFSQRYPKLAVVATGGSGELEVVLAFDCMRARVGDLRRFGRLKRGLEGVYREEGTDEEVGVQ